MSKVKSFDIIGKPRLSRENDILLYFLFYLLRNGFQKTRLCSAFVQYRDNLELKKGDNKQNV